MDFIVNEVIQLIVAPLLFRRSRLCEFFLQPLTRHRKSTAFEILIDGLIEAIEQKKIIKIPFISAKRKTSANVECVYREPIQQKTRLCFDGGANASECFGRRGGMNGGIPSGPSHPVSAA